MEEILKRIQTLQIRALHKNINCDVSLSLTAAEPYIEVRLNYFRVDDIEEQRVLNTKLILGSNSALITKKIKSIEKFINDIE